MGEIRVLAEQALSDAISNLASLNQDAKESCIDASNEADQVFEEANAEYNNSQQLLEIAKAAEATAHVNLIAAEGAVAVASAALAAAIAEANLPAIAASEESIFHAEQILHEAEEAYALAEKHRELMEKRLTLAEKCLYLAQEMNETLKVKLNGSLMQLDDLCMQGTTRLATAQSDLIQYMGKLSPSVVSSFNAWKNYRPASGKPITPNVLHDRLNASEDQIQATLAYIMATDEKFRDVVVRLRAQAENSVNAEQVERQIRKTVTGRVSEELVKSAFAPFGGKISTQEVKTFENGTYTKIDLVIKDLKEPLILGRGEGMAASAGGTVAIEVKSGKKEYLMQQKEHLQFQAQGHQDYDASCTICTRDIHDLPPESEQQLRKVLRDAGSPILGMLPRKETLDTACVNFVLNE